MSASATALAAGFAASLSVSGEWLTFRGRRVRALIDRQPYARVIRTPDFNVKGLSKIELLSASLSPVARVGETVVEVVGSRKHRITEVERPTGYSVRLTCEMHD